MTDQELIAELCVRVGMMMEDAAADAVTTSPVDPDELAGLLRRLQTIVKSAADLLTAARALANPAQ